MKINKTLTALIAGASLGLSGQAFAVGTAAGTEIQNKVTLSYDVGNATQDPVSNTAQFKVDNKIDMVLSWDTPALKPVAPGQTVFHKFTLQNDGNLNQPYNLSASVAASGTTIIPGTPNIDADSTAAAAPTFTFYAVDSEPSVGDPTVTALAAVPHATGTNTKIFWVGVNYPITADLEDTNKLGNYVTATADVSGNGNQADTDKNSNLEKQLFVNADGAGDAPADTANDAAISAVFGDEITSANFADSTDGLKLSVIVVNDPICNDDDSNYAVSGSHDSGTATTGVMDCNATLTPPSGYTPKAIPGALLEYTITAKNTGRSQAKLVGFSQNLSSLEFDGSTASDSLKAASIDHVVATMLNNNSVDAVVTSNTSVLDVDVTTFDADASITITFTAIVDDL